MKVGDLVRLKQEYLDMYDNGHKGLVGLVVEVPQKNLTHYRLVLWASSNESWLTQSWMYPATELEAVNESR
jgi:hypothetical protein